MKILFVSNYYPPYEVGGYEQLCRDVVERMRQRGHETCVLTSNRGERSTAASVSTQPVHRVLTIQPDYDRHLNPVWQFFLMRPRLDCSNQRRFRQIVECMQPEIIFFWNLQGLTRILTVDAESIPNVAVAYWLAGYSPTEPDEYWRYWSIEPKKRSYLGPFKAVIRNIAIRMLRKESEGVRPKMQHVAVVSEFMRRKGIDEGTLPEHAQVIYNGVEVEQFLLPVRPRHQEPLRLLLAGRISEDKGVHTAIEAIGHLVSDFDIQDVQLTIVGAGRADYVARLEEILNHYSIGRYVTIAGWLPRERMPELMSRNHVLLLPTIHPEPFARIVLEAMTSGLAVIAADTGGTNEVVLHGKTGLLFPAGDCQALAGEILNLVQNDTLREQLASAGQAVARNRYDLNIMVDRVEHFLMQAIEE